MGRGHLPTLRSETVHQLPLITPAYIDSPGFCAFGIAGNDSHRRHTQPKEGMAMTGQAPELAAVVARLENVERQNRRLKAAGIAVLVLAVAGLLMGQTMPRARIVEAEGFVLKDAAGKVRAELAGDNHLTRLRLNDENGEGRAVLTVAKDGPRLNLYDENGEVRAILTVAKDGPRLNLYDEDGKSRAILAVFKARHAAAGPREKAGLVLFGEDEKAVWSAP